ncbi:hypothetical protein AAG906_027256 [Vitis piasezkii]
MDKFSGYSKILMTPEDMEKKSFITKWGTYCYRVMPFGLKNVGATYQRATTTLFHDMMHRDVEVYVDDMIVKSRDRADHLAVLKRFFEKIDSSNGSNPNKCTFGVTFRKLLGCMVGERGIEVDPDKIESSLTCRTEDREKDRVFFDIALGCMLAQLDDLGKERAIYYLSKRMLDYETRYYSMHLISRLDPLRYFFDRPALIGQLMRWLVLLTEFDIHYVTQKSIRRSIIVDHLASLPVFDGKAIDDDFPDENITTRTSLSSWHIYFDDVAKHSGYRIGVLLISPHGDHIPRSIRLGFSDRHPATNNIGHWKTRDVKLRPYHAYFELLVGKFDDLSYTHLPRVQNQCADALDTLASMIDIPTNTIVHLLLIESRSIPAYCCLIDVAELDDDRASTDRVMREVHAGVYGPHMEGHMLARWGIDIIGKIFLKSSNGHEFILVFIDYFTKWAEAASYARLTSSRVTSFIISHIICHYGVPHEPILDRGVHFRADVDTLLQRYGATPYSLVYGIEVVLSVEIKMGSLGRHPVIMILLELCDLWIESYGNTPHWGIFSLNHSSQFGTQSHWLAWHLEPPYFFSLAFRALSSRPRVILLIYDQESFLAFRALSSQPRVILSI